MPDIISGMDELNIKLNRFLTVAEVADLLAITPNAVFDLIESGDLSAIVFKNNQVRISQYSFELFVQSHSDFINRNVKIHEKSSAANLP